MTFRLWLRTLGRLVRHPLEPSGHAILPLFVRRLLNRYMRARGDPPTDRGR